MNDLIAKTVADSHWLIHKQQRRRLKPAKQKKNAEKRESNKMNACSVSIGVAVNLMSAYWIAFYMCILLYVWLNFFSSCSLVCFALILFSFICTYAITTVSNRFSIRSRIAVCYVLQYSRASKIILIEFSLEMSWSSHENSINFPGKFCETKSNIIIQKIRRLVVVH